mgnify:CR=1 FL=1
MSAASAVAEPALRVISRPRDELSDLDRSDLAQRRLPTRAEVRAVIPDHCFEVSTGRSLLHLALSLALTAVLYLAVPKGFFPQQDTGRIFASIRGDQSISFRAMREKLDAFVDIVRQDPAVENVTAYIGGSRTNRGTMFISLKPLAQRSDSAEAVIERLRQASAGVPGASLYMAPSQEVRIGGRSSGPQYQYTLLSDDLDELRQWEPRVRLAMSRLPQLRDIDTDRDDGGRQIDLAIDRDAAAQFGIDSRQLGNLLNNAFGQRQVSTIYEPLNQYRVVLEVAPQFRDGPSDLELVRLVSPDGGLVPLSAVAGWTQPSASRSLASRKNSSSKAPAGKRPFAAKASTWRRTTPGTWARAA